MKQKDMLMLAVMGLATGLAMGVGCEAAMAADTSADKVKDFATYVTLVVTIASGVAAVTPTPAQGTIWWRMYRVIDFAALNVGKAKDQGEAGKVVNRG